MTDSASPSAAPPSTVASSDVLGAQPSPEDARQMIKDRIADPDFRTRLLKQDPAAKQDWDAIHNAAFPPPPQVTLEDAAQLPEYHEARRQFEATENGIAALLKVADLTPAQQDEIRRRQPIAKAEQDWARKEIDRLKRDKSFVRKYLDGDRDAGTLFTRLHQMITLPTAATPTTYPVKQ